MKTTGRKHISRLVDSMSEVDRKLVVSVEINETSNAASLKMS